MTFDNTIPKHLEDALSHHNFVRLFPSASIANAALFALRDVVETHPGFLRDDSLGSCLFGVNISNGTVVQGPPTTGNKEGTRRLQIALCRLAPDGADLGDVYARIDIPLPLLINGARKIRKFHVYQIRFNVSREPTLDYDSCAPLRAGYVGITKRGLFERYKEHEAKAAANSGSLLHTAWHALKANHPLAYPVLQFVGHCDTLEEAYQAEEKLVGEMTLAPKGLNAIPGGEAGIRELHRLGALAKRGGLPSAAERDRALATIERTAPAAHYRRAHIRRLSPERTTFVNGCWVSVKPALEAP